MITMSYQIENISKERKLGKKNQIPILQLRSAVIKMKNSLEALNIRFEQVEEA